MGSKPDEKLSSQSSAMDAEDQLDGDQNPQLSKDDEEEKKYDRQLRLWGVDAQKKMHDAKILLLGFNGLASETAKILALAGVNHITIVDDENKESLESDIHTNLFCGRYSSEEYSTRGEEIRNKIGRLNPRAKVVYEVHEELALVIKGDYLKEFDIVCLSKLMPLEEIYRLNDECREQNVMFYAQLDFGLFGFIFNDCGLNYKFSHEEFVQEPSEQIAVIEDDEDDKNAPSSPSKTRLSMMTIDDSDEGEDDNEDQRGTKRRRLDSPDEGKNTKKTKTSAKATPIPTTKSEPPERKKITKETTLKYVTFRDMMEHKSFNSVTNPALILSLAIYRCYDKLSLRPGRWQELEPFVELVLEGTKLDRTRVIKKLCFDWEDFLDGSYSPITSIVGGLTGQDILRAVSHKFIPLYNSFTFDGTNMRGTVDKIGF